MSCGKGLPPTTRENKKASPKPAGRASLTIRPRDVPARVDFQCQPVCF